MKRIISFLCAVSVAAAAAAFTPVFADTAIAITKSGGSLESIYAEWTNTKSATGYTITCTDENGGVTTADSELIRLYDGHYRVDVPGLRAGTYTVKITDSNGASAEAAGIAVRAHTREGFAFSPASPNGGKASGGYNDDGTPAAGAKIIYITQDNVNSVQATVGSKSYTGLQNILYAMGKDGSGTHYIIRIIGTIDGSKVSISNSSKDFEAKGLKNTTIEGIGEDTTLRGCAFFIKECSNFELRNIGEMLFLDDGIVIDGNNSNIWVHNNDIFYGKDLSPATGDGTGDADQVKGDGSLDIKNNSRYCTLSYNHFWDGGKVSLVISSYKNVDDTTSFLSYHHNWFDHSDSRHPRVRFATVHMYNNYFDGVSNYCSGVTSGASLFAEANYYKDSPRPFASSMQGTDSGTFSKEAGGIIKVYGNAHSGGDKSIYYSSKTGSDFDAYKAAARDEQIPPTITTKLNTFKGYTYNNTYNNFDTAADMYSYQPDSAEDIPSLVAAYAGRVNGGDVQYIFSKDDATDHSRMKKLDALLLNYEPTVKGTLLATYPATDGSGGEPGGTQQPSAAPTATTEPGSTETQKPTATPTATPSATNIPTAPPVSELTLQTEAKIWSFEGYDLSKIYDNMRFYYTSDKSISLVDTTYDKSYKKAVNLGGAGVYNSYRSAEVYVAPGSIKINAENTGSDRVMQVYINGTLAGEHTITKNAATTVTVDTSVDALIQFMSKSSGIRICSVEYTPSEVNTPEPTATPTATPEATATPEPTATPTAPPEATTAPEPDELTLAGDKTVDGAGIAHITARLSKGAAAELFVAQYDERGALKAVRLINTDEEKLEYEFMFDTKNGEDFRLMLWNDMLPACDAFKF